MNCGGITIGAEYDCLDPLKAKVSTRLLVGNLSDIRQIIFNVSEPSVITNIIMEDGKTMYNFFGVRSSVTPSMRNRRQRVTMGYLHEVEFSVYEVDTPQKVNLKQMGKIKQFVIYQNPKDSSLGDAVWEVMGLDMGMTAKALVRMAAEDGIYTVNLTTKEGRTEPKLPRSFFDTDIATTEALIDILAPQEAGELISPEAQLVLDRMV